MKISKKICGLSTIILSFAIISCSSPNGGLNSNGGNSSNSENNSSNPEIPISEFKWIMTRMELETRSNTTEYNYSSDYTYSYYNSEFDCENTSISVSSNSSTNTKTVSTFSQTGDSITKVENNYTSDGSTWVLSSESRYDYYKNDSLFISYHRKNYPAGTESTINHTIELLDNSNGIERYKVATPSNPIDYAIFEFANNKIQKKTSYMTESNKKCAEYNYIYSNNSILQANNIELPLTQFKSFDSNEQIQNEKNETLESVILNANNTITVRIGSSTNTPTDYSYTTKTFTRMQIPFSQQ